MSHRPGLRPHGFRPHLEALEDRALLSAGALDSHFGTGGEVRAPFPGYDVLGQALAVLPDGKLLLAGSLSKAGPAPSGDVVLTRLRADGATDATFGNAGKVILARPGSLDRAVAVLPTPDGKLLVLAEAANADPANASDGLLTRLLANGNPDKTFDGDGTLVLNLLGGADALRGGAVQPDGKILIIAAVNNDHGQDGGPLTAYNLLGRLNPGGTFDGTFGTAGQVKFPGVELQAVAYQRDGKILVAGVTVPQAEGDKPEFFLARFNADGTADPTFGTAGVVRTAVSNAFTTLGVNGLAVANDGGILIGGWARSADGATDFGVLLRYQPDGQAETGFGANGLALLDLAAGQPTPGGAFVDRVAFTPAGQILALTVYAHEDGGYTKQLFRLQADGEPDPAFGTDGVVEVQHLTFATPDQALAVQPDGRAVVLTEDLGSLWAQRFAGDDLPAGNAPPVAKPDKGATDEDTPVALDVLANDTDADGDPLYLTVVSTAGGRATVDDHGTPADFRDDRLVFTPGAGFHGTGQVAYQVSDGHGGTALGLVQIQVKHVNHPPVAVDDAYGRITEGSVLNVLAGSGVLANDRDPDGGQPRRALLVTGPAHGTLTLRADGGFLYRPEAGFQGEDGFTYAASDGSLSSAPATVTLTVTRRNKPPVAKNDAASTLEDAPVVADVLANDRDPDGDPLTIGDITSTQGTAVLYDRGTPDDPTDDAILFTPAPHFRGTAQVAYQVSDGYGGLATAVLRIQVTPVNHAPVAIDDAYRVTAGGKLVVDIAHGLTANDTDPDGNRYLVVQVVDKPQHGKLSQGSQGAFTYVPTPGFVGTDTFTYNAFDGQLASAAPATVTLTVAPPATVAEVAVNDGADQRSMVTQIAVTFSEVVRVDPGAFQLTRQGGSAVALKVTTAEVNGRTRAVLTFSGAGIVGGSLADGTYQLAISTSRVRYGLGEELDGNGDGKPGGTFGATLYRLFGDVNGDGRVDQTDATAFDAAYGSTLGGPQFVAAFDFDADKIIGPADQREFNRRLNKPLPA